MEKPSSQPASRRNTPKGTKNTLEQVRPRKMTRGEKKIAREIACHMSRIKKSNKKDNFRREMALLSMTTEFKFYGDIIIQPRDEAIRTAIESSKSDLNYLHKVFFVDGACFTGGKGRKRSPDIRKALGAAVVYMSSGVTRVWEERLFHPPKGGGYLQAELTAVAEGLAIAVLEILRAKDQDILGSKGALTESKVTIFTDCQGALQRIIKLREAVSTEQRLRGNPIVRKLITRSQYLNSLGVKVELCWVPGHSHVEGNERAHVAARVAASPDLGICLDEGLQMIEYSLLRHVKEHS